MRGVVPILAGDAAEPRRLGFRRRIPQVEQLGEACVLCAENCNTGRWEHEQVSICTPPLGPSRGISEQSKSSGL